MGVFWGAFAAFMPEIKARIGASDGEFGVVMLVATLGALSAMWAAPWISQRLGPRVLPLGVLLMGLCFQAPMQVGTLVAFAGLMLLATGATGLLDIVMNGQVSHAEVRSGRSLMNLNHAVFSLAYAAAALLVGVAREAGFSPQLVFFAFLIGVLPLVWWTYQGQTEHLPETSGQTGGGAPATLPSAVFWGGIIVFAAFLAENATEGWSALYIERELGGRAAEGAFGPAVLGLTMGVGRLAGQVFVSRSSPAMLLGLAALVSAMGTLLAAAATAPGLAWLGFGAMGLGVSVVAPMAFALVGQAVSSGARERAISRAAMIGYAGFFIGPPMMGFVAEASSLRMSFVLVAVVLALIPLCLRFFRAR